MVYYNHILARRGAFDVTRPIYFQCRTCCPTGVTCGELACNLAEAFSAEGVGKLHLWNFLNHRNVSEAIASLMPCADNAMARSGGYGYDGLKKAEDGDDDDDDGYVGVDVAVDDCVCLCVCVGETAPGCKMQI